MINDLTLHHDYESWDVTSVTLEAVDEKGVLTAMEVACTTLSYARQRMHSDSRCGHACVVLKSVPAHVMKTIRFIPSRVRFTAKFLLRTYVLHVRDIRKLADDTLSLQLMTNSPKT